MRDGVTTDEDLERCMLDNPREILFQIKHLATHDIPVLALFEGQRSILSLISGLTEDGSRFFFEEGGDEQTNRALLRTGRCFFSCMVDGVRVEFSGADVQTVQYGGRTVFSALVPSTLLRLQRRDAFRLVLPSVKPYFCSIRHGGKEFILPVYDLSIGGLGLQFTSEPPFNRGEIFERCIVNLRDLGAITAQIEIRYIFRRQNRSGNPIWRVGCRFQHLSRANETLLQRFMAKVESERRLSGA